eukprot:CAMPEP_0177171670 /NCGR_PEP_ID=MMETSP0367-20130122/10731_1 /TAXON_ID=447022 ORGANISM="Scrippsiella hangoei-like, Strain SHHI-4" /NCGR_SAMPLE_ID=MMETSP0367 /ASSEMBLY_ACC=CAM_ASM_000362 /LENGTH=66 /DNA_ID=CAMNT_0018617901 /DNA_START=484 /DNA_END=681 /DNA_ORIENTATION=+
MTGLPANCAPDTSLKSASRVWYSAAQLLRIFWPTSPAAWPPGDSNPDPRSARAQLLHCPLPDILLL